MSLRVVGAGVGRTGTNSLKLALERLLDAPCHHMFEVRSHPDEMAGWIDAMEGRAVDWSALLSGYAAQVDWPGASFWPELAAANPEALVLLSVRDPESWYRSASSTIFPAIMSTTDEQTRDFVPALVHLMRDRFSDKFDDATAMMDAFERHNAAVRTAIPPERLLEWTAADGWEPICDRLRLPLPSEPFPSANSSEEFQSRQAAESP